MGFAVLPFVLDNAGRKKKKPSHFGSEIFAFNFSSWFSFLLNSTYGYQDDGVRREEEQFMALNSYFYFSFLPFSLRPLTPRAFGQSLVEWKKEREEKAVRHNVCSMLWFFVFYKSNSDDVIELCHENFMLQSHVVKFTSSLVVVSFIVSCLMGKFYLQKANPTNVIVRVVFIFVFRLHISSFAQHVIVLTDTHTRDPLSVKYFLSHLFDVFSRREIFLLFFHFWRKTYFVQN